jgi:hypothetical protein
LPVADVVRRSLVPMIRMARAQPCASNEIDGPTAVNDARRGRNFEHPTAWPCGQEERE